jgi:hypothetical protein
MGIKEFSLRVNPGEVWRSNHPQLGHITTANMISCAVQINAYNTIGGL